MFAGVVVEADIVGSDTDLISLKLVDRQIPH
jgi:hypothetical protein